MSLNVNTVLFGGRLCADPEIKQVGGTVVCNLRLATNRAWKDKNTGEKREEVLFLDAEAWGNTGENLHKFFRKGAAIFITGHLKLEQWEERDTGKKRQKHKLVVDEWSFVESKNGAPAQQHAERDSGRPDAAPGPGYAQSDDSDSPF